MAEDIAGRAARPLRAGARHGIEPLPFGQHRRGLRRNPGCTTAAIASTAGRSSAVMARQCMSGCFIMCPLHDKQKGPRCEARASMIANAVRADLLLLAILEGSAQDVAERSARIGRTVVGDGFLFLGDFERLDRQRDARGLAIVLGDACVDLFALGETLRTLVVAIAAEVGTADEGGHLACRRCALRCRHR